MKLRGSLSQSWLMIQGTLFPWLEEEPGPLTEKQQQWVMTPELVRIEEHLHEHHGGPGRPPKSRAAIARAFAEFAASRLPERVHAARVQASYAGEFVGHISRDSTAIGAREKPEKKEARAKAPAKRGRPKAGNERPKAMTRLERRLE